MAETIDEYDVQELLTMVNQPETDGHGQMVKESERLATVDGVAIAVIPAEVGKHKARHFHARFNSDESASVDIDTLEVYANSLPKKRLKKVLDWASTRKDKLAAAFDEVQAGRRPKQITAGSMQPISGSGDLSWPLFDVIARHALITESDEFINRVRSQMVENLMSMGLSDDKAKKYTEIICRRISKVVDDIIREPIDLLAMVEELRRKMA